MMNVKVDLLGGDTERRARRTAVWTACAFAVVVGLFAAVGAGASYRTAMHGTTVLEELGNLPVIADIRRLAWGEAAGFEVADDRLTFLFLGIGGEGHAGSNLTDTMLLATVNPEDGRVGVLSIPRDLAYPMDGGRFMKINGVHAYAEQAHPGEGAAETATALEALLQIEIDHVVRVDFRGFVMLVDALGGIDITVERAFTDTEYPTEDDLWQTVRFEKGSQHMDGERALIFARSRHGNNGEAGDFARNHRQQLVMLAIKDKLLSRGSLNPQRVMDLYKTVAQNVQTDLSPWELVKLAPLAQDFSAERIVLHTLTDGPDGELVPGNVDGAFMLFPRQQDWSEIRTIAGDLLKTKEEHSANNRPVAPVRIEIRNGTYLTGLASQAGDRLKTMGYDVADVGNAGERGYERTVIFDLTDGKKSEELTRLRTLLDANVSPTLPAWAAPSSTASSAGTPATDFIIILGESTRGMIDHLGTP
ncbi:MAG: hypothetical protein RL141_995 [Candidatus Parcubacteria bacterium]|jgi:LCP family protein required for cell wall assembly